MAEAKPPLAPSEGGARAVGSEHVVQRSLLEPLRAGERLSLAGDSPLSPGAIRRSFLIMALCFSGNHACVTTVLGLASTELGERLGGYSSGTLYLCYTLSALLGATAAVQRLGQKGALLGGSLAYCAYVAAFLVAYIGRDQIWLPWSAALVGSVVGGLAAGWLWSAQGAYLTAAVSAYVRAQQEETGGEYRSASYYGSNEGSDASASSGGGGGGGGDDDDDDNAPVELHDVQRAMQTTSATFAGLFSTAYLGIEFCSKLLAAGLLYLPSGRLLTFTTLTAIAVLSAAGLHLITDLEAHPSYINTPGRSAAKSYGGAFAAIQLLFTDKKMALMYPVQMGFGFSSSFLTFYVSKEVIDEYLGEFAVALLSALVVLVGAVLSMPNSWLAHRVGKTPVMVIGIAAFILVSVCFIAFSEKDLGHWAALVPLYIVYGYGRCVIEGQNKAVMVEFFEKHGKPLSTLSDEGGVLLAGASTILEGAAWGANVIVASGGSSALGFFLFPHLSKDAMAAICCVTSCLALVTFLAAKRMHEAEKRSPPLASGDAQPEPADNVRGSQAGNAPDA